MGIADGQPSLSKFYGLQVKAESVRIKSGILDNHQKCTMVSSPDSLLSSRMRVSAQTACGGMKTHENSLTSPNGPRGPIGINGQHFTGIFLMTTKVWQKLQRVVHVPKCLKRKFKAELALLSMNKCEMLETSI